MRADGFGKRIVESQSRDLTVVETAPDDSQHVLPGASDPEGTKDRVRTILMQRVNAMTAVRMEAGALRSEITRMVGDIATEQRVRLNEREEAALAREILDDMLGLGPLEPLLADNDVNDILVNGPFEVFVERAGILEKSSAKFRDQTHLVNVAQRIASAVGRRIDEANPMADARLADGSRVNIVLPPLVLNGGTISIRKFSKRRITLDIMAGQQNLSQSMARFLDLCARLRLNILISGGTGSGKTTLLNAVSRLIDPRARIITIEDAVELQLQQPHIVQMETRTPNIEGVGKVTQRDLLRNALRMRPDRIIIGEVRGEESFDMLQAMNTGHDGSMSTIHANTPRDALYRLENMVLMGAVNLPLRAIRGQIASAINIIVQVERMRDGVRRVQNIVEVVGMEGDVITTQDVFTFRQTGGHEDRAVNGKFVGSGLRPHCATRAAEFGLERQLLETVGIES